MKEAWEKKKKGREKEGEKKRREKEMKERIQINKSKSIHKCVEKCNIIMTLGSNTISVVTSYWKKKKTELCKGLQSITEDFRGIWIRREIGHKEGGSTHD